MKIGKMLRYFNYTLQNPLIIVTAYTFKLSRINDLLNIDLYRLNEHFVYLEESDLCKFNFGKSDS